LLRVEQLQLATLLGITPDIDDQGLWPLLARQRPLWIDVGLSDLFTHRGGINWFGNNRHNRPGLRTTPRTPPRINLHLPTHQRYTAGIQLDEAVASLEGEFAAGFHDHFHPAGQVNFLTGIDELPSSDPHMLATINVQMNSAH